MQMIDKEGKYPVTIGKCYFEALPIKGGDSNRMALVMPLTTDDEQMIFHRLSFTRTIISGGRNQGKALYDVSAAECVALGMSEPFAPSKIGELEGQHALAVVETSDYGDGDRMEVKYLNPRKAQLDVSEAERMWAELSGGNAPVEAKPVATAQTVADDDDLPF